MPAARSRSTASRRWLARGCLATALLPALACKAPAPVSLPKPEVALTLPAASPDDPVVATIGAVAIHASHVVAQMRGGQDARRALDTLIDLEVLLARARARHLDQGSEADESKKLILAQGLLRKDFEPATVPSRLPEADLRAYYEQNKQIYVHPAMKHLTILDLLVGRKTPAEATAQSNELAALIASRRDWTDEEFARLAEDQKWRARTLRVARVFQSESGPYSAALARVVMSLPVGRVSPMVRDGDGFHIALVVGELPARDTTFEEVREELALALQPGWQTYRFADLGNRLLDSAGVKIYPERFARAPAR